MSMKLTGPTMLVAKCLSKEKLDCSFSPYNIFKKLNKSISQAKTFALSSQIYAISLFVFNLMLYTDPSCLCAKPYAGRKMYTFVSKI